MKEGCLIKLSSTSKWNDDVYLWHDFPPLNLSSLASGLMSVNDIGIIVDLEKDKNNSPLLWLKVFTSRGILGWTLSHKFIKL